MPVRLVGRKGPTGWSPMDLRPTQVPTELGRLGSRVVVLVDVNSTVWSGTCWTQTKRILRPAYPLDSSCPWDLNPDPG